MGSIFEIVCEARGIPHPIISWQHNGQSNSSQLENNRRRLVEVRDRHMAGKIECIANNGVGKPGVAGIDMVVLCTYLFLSAVFFFRNLIRILNSIKSSST